MVNGIVNGPLALASFLLLICLEVGRPCPPLCKYCSTGLAECEQVSSLQEVLPGLPNSTEKILLRHGNLSKIPPLSFQNFPRLHLLSVTGFPFSSLANMTFVAKDSSSLRSLDLSSNSLVSCGIQPSAFAGLGILEELILTDNALDTVKSSWFLEMPLLAKLLLSGNKITYLPPRTLESLAKLNELVMSSNFIRYLSRDTFYGLASLTKLDLSSNEILFINNEVFQPLHALTHLQLFNNKLTALASIPDSLAALFLNENPWFCDCHLVSSMQLLKEKVQTPGGFVCNNPPSLRGCQVLSVGPEVCAFLPQETTSKFDLLYGFTGGLFFSFIVCLIACFVTKHWKYSRVTNQAEDGHSSQKDSVEEFPRSVTSVPSVSPLPHSGVIKTSRTRGFQKESKADTKEDTPGDVFNNTPQASREYAAETGTPVKLPGMVLLPAPRHAGKKILTIYPEGMEIESPDKASPALRLVGSQSVETAAEIPRCVSAPGLLPNVELQPSLKRDHGLYCPSFNHEKTVQKREQLEIGEPALVKYFETHWEEQALSPFACLGGSQCFRTLVNVVSPAESATQTQTGREGGHTASSKRSKSWSSLHFSISSQLAEAAGERASKENGETGFEAHSVHSRRGPDCETLCQRHFIKGESTATTEDGCTDRGREEPAFQKNICLENCRIAQSVSDHPRESMNTGNSNLAPEPEAPADSLLSDFTNSGEHASASNPDNKGIKPAAEDKLITTFSEKEALPSRSFCDNDRSGEERPYDRIPRSETPGEESSLKNNKLSRERFWKSHTNCCNEYQPCPAAQKVLKELKTARVNSREQLDLSPQAPPSDLDLLREQDVTTTFLARYVNSDEPLTTEREKGNDSTLLDVHASFAPDWICHQELPEEDNSISCGLPQTRTLQRAQPTDIAHQEVGADCCSLRQATVDPVAEFQESTEKCTITDQTRMADLGNASIGANPPARRSENAGSEHLVQDWKSLDAETDLDKLAQTNTISGHLAGGEKGWVTASPTILHRELCLVKSQQLSAIASAVTYLPLTPAPGSRTSSPNSRKGSLMDVHEVGCKGAADRVSNCYLPNEVISAQQMHVSPSEEKHAGRLREASANAECLLNEDKGAQVNIDVEKTKTVQSDYTEHNSYEVEKAISSNNTDDQKNFRELLGPSESLRVDCDTWHNIDTSPCRSSLENACPIAANHYECDGVACKKDTGQEHFGQPAASKSCKSSADPALAIYESQAEEISVPGYNGTVSPSCQVSSSAGIQQVACNKASFQFQNILVNLKPETEADMKRSDSKNHMLVAVNTDTELCEAGDNSFASPYLGSRQPRETGLHSKIICLPEQSDRSFLQQESALSNPWKNDLQQNWNESPSVKQPKNTYHSVFRLPTDGLSLGKLRQNLDCTLDLPELNKRSSPTTPVTPTPCSLGQDPQLRDKATYLNCLYNPKTPRKQTNELSVLSNLRYCKISANVSLSVEEEERRSKWQKKENDPTSK
ncbi:uncharacterized protein LOC102443492 isoform X1 [Pelodiscus sinensis]|uniref:uncharacterized protein LOC102443492 isoform X1 n=1 Tax=Pelodiscus sinensis TaxID=13735 RepID=UPI003F6B9437